MVQPLVTSGGRIALACAPPTLVGLLVAMVHLHVLARPDEVMNCSPASETVTIRFSRGLAMDPDTHRPRRFFTTMERR